MKSSLRSKLIGGFAIIFLWILAVEVVNMCASKSIESRLASTGERDVKSANILNEVARKTELVYANTLLHLYATSTGDMERYESEISKGEKEISTLLESFEKTCLSQTELDKLAEFRFAWEACSRRDEQSLPASRANHKDEAFALANEHGSAGLAAQTAFEKLKDLQEANLTAAKRRTELANQERTRSQNLLRSMSLLAIIPGLVWGVYLSSQIADAINLVSNAAQLIAAGDFDWSITVKTGDELESVAESFNRISRQAKKALAARREASERWQRAMTERKQAEKQLVAEQERLAATLRLIKDGVILTDMEGKITFINEVAKTLTGWVQEKALGRSLDEVFSIFAAETHQRCKNPVQQMWESGERIDSPNHTFLVARDGTEHMIAYRSAPIYDPDGDIVGAVLSFHAIAKPTNAELENQALSNRTR